MLKGELRPMNEMNSRLSVIVGKSHIMDIDVIERESGLTEVVITDARNGYAILSFACPISGLPGIKKKTYALSFDGVTSQDSLLFDVLVRGSGGNIDHIVQMLNNNNCAAYLNHDPLAALVPEEPEAPRVDRPRATVGTMANTPDQFNDIIPEIFTQDVDGTIEPQVEATQQAIIAPLPEPQRQRRRRIINTPPPQTDVFADEWRAAGEAIRERQRGTLADLQPQATTNEETARIRELEDAERDRTHAMQEIILRDQTGGQGNP